MIGFRFKNKHCWDFGLIMRSVNRQLLPSIEDQYEYVPRRDGAYLFPGAYQDRFIEVELSFVARSQQEIRERAREIAAWLSSRQRERLVFDDEPDKHYMAKVANQIDLEPMMRAGRFQVIFRCSPFALSEEHTNTSTATGSPTKITVSAVGTVQTPPVITLRNLGGPINGFRIIREVEVD